MYFNMSKHLPLFPKFIENIDLGFYSKYKKKNKLLNFEKKKVPDAIY